MTDKKDAPPKGPERRTPDNADPAAKRPYTTLDLKATEVAASGSKQAAKPNATGPSANPPPAEGKPGGDRTAAARIAAAAADLRDRAAQEKRGADASRPYASMAYGNTESPVSSVTGVRRHASHLAAGILGGVIALVGSQLLLSSRAPVSPPVSDAALADVRQKLAALEKSASERPGAPLPADAVKRLEVAESELARLDELRRSFSALQQEQMRLAEQAEALQTSVERPSVDRDAAGRLDRVEEQLAALSAAASSDPEAAARIGQMAQITTRLNELEAAGTVRLEALRKEMSQELDARAAGIAEAGAAATAQRLDREIAAIKSDATRVGQRVDVFRAGMDRVDQSLRGLQADTATLGTAIERLRSEIENRLASTAKMADISSAVEPAAARISALETSLQSVVTAEKDRKANAERIVLSLELANLKRALDRGASYSTELAAVKAAAGGHVDIGSLERYQHDGVPTQADLARDFRGIASAVLDADAEQPDASLVERMLSGVRTIVRVRKLTHSPDDTSTEAIVGRIEAAVRENRLADALTEAKKLPARAAVPAHDWLGMVQVRQSVDAALARIDADLKASLARTPAARGARQ